MKSLVGFFASFALCLLLVSPAAAMDRPLGTFAGIIAQKLCHEHADRTVRAACAHYVRYRVDQLHPKGTALGMCISDYCDKAQMAQGDRMRCRQACTDTYEQDN